MTSRANGKIIPQLSSPLSTNPSIFFENERVVSGDATAFSKVSFLKVYC